MAKLPQLSGKALVQLLQREGYSVSHVRGSHHYLRKGGQPALLVIPVHGNRDLPIGTLRSILRQAGMTVEQLAILLNQT